MSGHAWATPNAGRPWDGASLVALLRLHQQGASAGEIAEKLGRSTSAVARHIKEHHATMGAHMPAVAPAAGALWGECDWHMAPVVGDQNE